MYIYTAAMLVLLGKEVNWEMSARVMPNFIKTLQLFFITFRPQFNLGTDGQTLAARRRVPNKEPCSLRTLNRRPLYKTHGTDKRRFNVNFCGM
jgi:hypothetical protein